MSLPNILDIDINIKNSLMSEYKKLPKYKKQLEILQSQLKLCDTFNNKKELQSSIDKLEQKILKLNNNLLYEEYICSTNDIIEKYSKLHGKRNKISFDSDDKKDPEKEKLITEYIDIAGKYVVLNINLSKKKNDNKCSQCSSTDIKNAICNNCGTEDTVYIDNSFKDSDRINTNSKYKYERKQHFNETIKQFQGEQTKKINSAVFVDLEKEFEKNYLVNDKKYEGKNPVEKRHLKYSRISKEHIRIFLKKTSHSKHYEDSNYLYHYYTGKPCPDISSYISDLQDDFAKLIEAFDKMLISGEIKGRTSFLNSQYILFQLLRRHKYKCNVEDFNLLKTKDKVQQHDDIYFKLCQIVKFDFIPMA